MTVTEERHAVPFRGQWKYDGQGINRDGERVLTLDNPPHTVDTPEGPRRNPERDRIGEAVAAFCQHAKCLEVRDFGGKHPPQLFLTLDGMDESSAGDTVCTVEVKRGTKTARFHLRLYVAPNGNVKAILNAQGKNRDTTREVTGQFVEWDT